MPSDRSDSRTDKHPRRTAVHAIDEACNYGGQQATNYLLEGVACALLSVCDELAAIRERLDQLVEESIR